MPSHPAGSRIVHVRPETAVIAVPEPAGPAAIALPGPRTATLTAFRSPVLLLVHRKPPSAVA
ncbi:MAG: hypothetical protein ACYCO9_20310 [Streptosporangiaceae bacterium]